MTERALPRNYIHRAAWGALHALKMVSDRGVRGADFARDLPKARSLITATSQVRIVDVVPPSATVDAAVVDQSVSVLLPRVLSNVSASVAQRKVIDSVVTLDFVQMMDVEAGRDRAMRLLPDPAVLVDDAGATRGDPDADIPVRIDEFAADRRQTLRHVLAAALHRIPLGPLSDAHRAPRRTLRAVPQYIVHPPHAANVTTGGGW